MPPLETIRSVSAAIATAVAQVAYDRGLATEPMRRDLQAHVESLIYEPGY